MIKIAAVWLVMLGLCVGISACSSTKKKGDGPKSMFGYPYKGRQDQVKDAFGG